METTHAHDQHFEEMRREMVEQITFHAGFVGEETGKPALDNRVIDVVSRVPRHEYVPVEIRPFAYLDQPLPIGFGKTISQPFIVALMTDLLDLRPTDRVLEIGTGLGYQTAILASLAERVYTVEIIEELAAGAERRLREHGFGNIEMLVGDGSAGWSQNAPYDKVIVAAAPELIPATLIGQLKPGGRMVIPAGLENAQQLLLVEKDADGRAAAREVLRVRFAPLMSAG